MPRQKYAKAMQVKRAVKAKFILKLSPMKMTDRKAYISRANCRPSTGRPVASRAWNCPVAYISPKKVYDRKKEPYCRHKEGVSSLPTHNLSYHHQPDQHDNFVHLK